MASTLDFECAQYEEFAMTDTPAATLPGPNPQEELIVLAMQQFMLTGDLPAFIHALQVIFSITNPDISYGSGDSASSSGDSITSIADAPTTSPTIGIPQASELPAEEGALSPALQGIIVQGALDALSSPSQKPLPSNIGQAPIEGSESTALTSINNSDITAFTSQQMNVVSEEMLHTMQIVSTDPLISNIDAPYSGITEVDVMAMVSENSLPWTSDDTAHYDSAIVVPLLLSEPSADVDVTPPDIDFPVIY
jgi:hypothetical protein